MFRNLEIGRKLVLQWYQRGELVDVRMNGLARDGQSVWY